MKKRAMKKWIPKETCYCYEHLVKAKGSRGLRYVGHCKWRKLRKHINKEYGTEKEWYCAYLGKFDDELECGLLWDACKECGEHYETDRYWNRCARKDYNRKRGKVRSYKINPKEPTNMPKCFDCEDFFTCDGQCDEIECEK